MKAVGLGEQEIRDLVGRAKGGDREAFDRLALRFRGDLEAFVSSRLGAALRGTLEPPDLVQETLLKAFQGLDRFTWNGPESFRRWLCAIAEHLIRNASRKRSRSMQSLSFDITDSGPSPSRALRREERFQRLGEALKKLSPDHRQVIELARIEGLKIQEIADRMERSPGAVKQLLGRALEQLRSRFGDTESLSLPDGPVCTGSGGDG